MAYATIQPPFTLKFREMSKQELKDYYQWFLRLIPERMVELEKAVQQTPGFEDWQPDYTPASLDLLGDWFAAQARTRKRTPEEALEITSRSSFPINIPDEELTNNTFSLAMDIGMYISQIFLRNHPSLRWDQEFGGKKSIDYAQPVLIDFVSAPFNPVRMMVTLAYGLVTKAKGGKALRNIYDIWSKQAKP